MANLILVTDGNRIRGTASWTEGFHPVCPSPKQTERDVRARAAWLRVHGEPDEAEEILLSLARR